MREACGFSVHFVGWAQAVLLVGATSGGLNATDQRRAERVDAGLNPLDRDSVGLEDGAGGRRAKPFRGAVHVYLCRRGGDRVLVEVDLVEADVIHTTEPNDVLDAAERRALRLAQRRA